MMEIECSAKRARFWVLPLAVVGAIAAACGPAAAADRSMDDLIGHWCGGPGVDLEYVFASDRLSVTARGGRGRPNVLHIARVEASPDWINIIWSGGGNTVYWKFSSDGRTMYKHANETGDMGPEQEFHRC
ncbi:MAG TPA: hypothetical protein VKX28_28605 [Xanthobacteraceae bacterium]|nr:hypothetical protein [Xanthobacteraceae bacterium]